MTRSCRGNSTCKGPGVGRNLVPRNNRKTKWREELSQGERGSRGGSELTGPGHGGPPLLAVARSWGFFFFSLSVIESNKFSLMDKETELQGSDVNLPKKEDLMRCSCCLSQTRFLPSSPHAFL